MLGTAILSAHLVVLANSTGLRSNQGDPFQSALILTQPPSPSRTHRRPGHRPRLTSAHFFSVFLRISQNISKFLSFSHVCTALSRYFSLRLVTAQSRLSTAVPAHPCSRCALGFAVFASLRRATETCRGLPRGPAPRQPCAPPHPTTRRSDFGRPSALGSRLCPPRSFPFRRDRAADNLGRAAASLLFDILISPPG